MSSIGKVVEETSSVSTILTKLSAASAYKDANEQRDNVKEILNAKLNIPIDSSYGVLLMGDSSVGKSCLLLSMVDGTYKESFILTIGGDFKDKTVNSCGQNVKLRIWDTCGSVRNAEGSVRAARPHVIAICFDVTDTVSFNNVKHWLSEIRRYAASDVKVILIGNKCDDESNRVVPYQDAKEYADKESLHYFETSAKLAVNIDNVAAAMMMAPYVDCSKSVAAPIKPIGSYSGGSHSQPLSSGSSRISDFFSSLLSSNTSSSSRSSGSSSTPPAPKY